MYICLYTLHVHSYTIFIYIYIRKFDFNGMDCLIISEFPSIKNLLISKAMLKLRTN